MGYPTLKQLKQFKLEPTVTIRKNTRTLIIVWYVLYHPDNTPLCTFFVTIDIIVSPQLSKIEK